MEGNIEQKKIILGQIFTKLSLLSEADNALDTKAGVLLAFEVAVFIAAITQDYLCLEFANLFFLFSIILLFIVTWPKNYNLGVIGEEKINTYIKKEIDDLLEVSIINANAAFRKNSQHLSKKVLQYKIAISLFAGGIIIVLMASGIINI